MKLFITRGLPGSGKTTTARDWVAGDPANRARVNRDDLRAQLHDSAHLGPDTERQIRATRDAMIVALLDLGVDVVNDDTNLPIGVVNCLRSLALSVGAGFEVWDLTNVDVGECVRRDAARVLPVGEKVIRDMWARHIAGRTHCLDCGSEF